jgi:hypothetical protein
MSPIVTIEKTPKNALDKSFACKVEAVPSIAHRWRRVEAFAMDDPTAAEPLSFTLWQEMQWTEEFSALAILEYKRFMLLCSIFPDGNMTPSVHVDTVWHLHLLYTRSYQRFCQETLDCAFFHHEPSKGGEQEEALHQDAYSDTLAAYVDTFGMEPPVEIWGARIRSEL